jgi:hypothetical protein
MQLDPTLYMVVTFVVLLSSALWLFIAMMSTEYSIWLRVAMFVVGILAFYLLFNRDIYLPFLGEAAIPTGILKETKSNGNVHFKIANLPPNSKVIYWAAIPSNNKEMLVLEKSRNAYGSYVNGGVVVSGADGSATISFDCPQTYVVGRLGFKYALPKHVHYRYQLSDKQGLMSRVYTEKITCEI